jgi:arylsulfatase A-like enzyme
MSGVVAILLVIAGQPSVLAKPAHPNILFILTDDQRLGDIEHMKSLNSLLVEQGAFFKNYFDNVSLCCPSRTSILRGQCAHNTGILTNKGKAGGWQTAFDHGLENSTVATWLHNQGYYTALIGKYLNGYPGTQPPTYIPAGWDYWASASKGNPYSEYNYTLNENGKLVSYGQNPEDYGTDVYANKAKQVIKECAKSGKPFFIYLAFYAPHAPATPAPRHLSLFHEAKVPRSEAFNEKDVSNKPQFIQRLEPLTDDEVRAEDAFYGKRLRSLQAVDEAIRNLYETLKENNQLDETYIVFTSDNGFHLGEHRMRAGKQSAYETDIHLPLIVRGPGVPHRQNVEAIVGNIDLAPTFADIASAKPPAFVDGRSILPFLSGLKPDTAWRKRFLVEHYKFGAARLPASGAARRGNNTPVRSDTAADDEPHDQARQSVNSESQEPSLPASKEAAPGARRRRAGKMARLREGSAIPEFQAVRTGDSSFVHYVTGEKEFYNVVSDPSQVNNLAASKASQAELNNELEKINALKTASGENARKLESMP